MNLWIVGQWREGEPWEFQGVFDSEKKAVTACLNRNYFVMPCELNKPLPDEPKDAEVRYPLADSE